MSDSRSLVVGGNDAGESHMDLIDNFYSSSISRIVVTILRAVNSRGLIFEFFVLAFPCAIPTMIAVGMISFSRISSDAQSEDEI